MCGNMNVTEITLAYITSAVFYNDRYRLTFMRLLAHLNSEKQIHVTTQGNSENKAVTHLASSLDVGVDSWVSRHCVAVKGCLREFVEDWIIVPSNTRNL